MSNYRILIDKSISGTIKINIESTLANKLKNKNNPIDISQLQYLLDTIKMNEWILPNGSYGISTYLNIIYIDYYNILNKDIVLEEEIDGVTVFNFERPYNASKAMEYKYIVDMLE